MSGRDFTPPLPGPKQGIPEPHYPFHDRTVVITSCGRLCLYRKKINLSVTLAGQAVGIKEVDNGIWLVSFMDYDLGYIDLEGKNFAAPRKPLRAKSVTYVLGTNCYPCVRSGQVSVVAEEEGFEPPDEFPRQRFSRPPP